VPLLIVVSGVLPIQKVAQTAEAVGLVEAFAALVRKHIREGDAHVLFSEMQTGKKHNMHHKAKTAETMKRLTATKAVWRRGRLVHEDRIRDLARQGIAKSRGDEQGAIVPPAP
jgi:hypothetical protein